MLQKKSVLYLVDFTQRKNNLESHQNLCKILASVMEQKYSEEGGFLKNTKIPNVMFNLF
jgi:hypothetical protein